MPETETTEPRTSMGGLDVDVPDPIIMPEDSYELSLNSAPVLLDQEPDEGKQYGGTGQYVKSYLEFVDHPEAAVITHILMLPHEESDERESRQRRRALRQFFEAFEIDHKADPINFEEGVGRTAWASVKGNPAKGGYDESNGVRRFVKKDD